jgi:carbon storage regulator
MLVLTRRKSEQLVLDGRIVVTVLQVRGRNVKLGIEAPPEVPVRRREVFQPVSESPVLESVRTVHHEPERASKH